MRVVQRCRRLTTAIAASAFLSLTSVAAPPSVAAPHAGPRIRFLHRSEPAGALARLADEVRIYTSDLAADVVVDSASVDVVPATPTDASLVLIWLEHEGTASRIHVLRGEDGRQVQIPLSHPDNPADLTRAALKVRAFVAESRRAPGTLASHEAAVESSAVLPTPTPPPEPARPPAPEAPPKAAEPPVIPAAPESPPVTVSPQPVQPPFEAQLLGSAVYAFGPGQPAVEGTLRGLWWHGRLGVGVEASLLSGFDMEGTDDTRTHVSDLPFGVEGLVRTTLGPIELAAGPRLRLHLLEARARIDGSREGSDVRPSAGLGGLLVARWAFTSHFAVVASASAEALVPHWMFLLDDGSTPRAPTGMVAIGAGLSWRGP